MALQFVKGDLFLSRAQTLAHGCNTRGRMGAGIAVEFKRRFPEMYQDYRRRCHKNEFRPGQICLYTSCTPWVLNLATQDSLGGARLEYVQQCFQAIADSHSQSGITSLAMPRIAAGLGGLEWDDVVALLRAILGPLPIPIVVYEEYKSGFQAQEFL